VGPTAILNAVKTKETTPPLAAQSTASYINDNKRENLARNAGREGKEEE
jgi:hypothetical protein